MSVKEFFNLTLNKILIAKIFGIPLIIADLLFDIFSYFKVYTVVKVVALVVASYLLACAIDYSLSRKKLMRTSDSRTSAGKF